MPRRNKGSRGVPAKGISNFIYELQDSPTVTRHPRVHRRGVDPAILKRAYMLHNFQFLLLPEVQGMKSMPGLPQGQRRLNEALMCGDSAPPWDAVSAVVVRWTLDEFQCPICLDTPVAARITDCGHVFCLPCMLQYLSKWKAENRQCTCPVCQNFVASSVLRPCIFQPSESPCPGKRARFTLLKHQKGSCVLFRHDDHRWNMPPMTDDELQLPFYGEPSATHSRYVLATTDSESTLRHLDCVAISDRLSEMSTFPRPLTQFDDEVERSFRDSLKMLLQDQGAPLVLATTGFRNSPPIAPRPSSIDREVTYELYGESEGQPYYIHPITFRMLLDDANARGSQLESVIDAPVEEIVTFTQTEASKKRYKAFAHVPLHGTVKLCLLDLTDIVLPSTIEAFAAMLSRIRETRRQRKAGSDNIDSDSSWRAYLLRYRASTSATTAGTVANVSSDFSTVSEMLPSLELPSLELPSSGVTLCSDPGCLSGDSSLDTRQRATKKRDSSFPTCWTAENSRRLFMTPPQRPAVPTWGGHAFNPHKPSGSGLLAGKETEH